jgi:outer membrane protein
MVAPALAALIWLASAVTGATGTPLLTLEVALDYTRKQQPQLREAQAAAAAADFRTSAARAQYFPQLSATARFQRSGTALFNADSAPGDSVAEFLGPNTLDRYNTSLTINQLIYDFGRTPQEIAAVKANAASLTAALDDAAVESAFATRTAFFQAQAALALRESAQQSLTNQRRHASYIAAQVEVGLRPPIDRLQAAADVASAELRFIQAANNYETAKAQLLVAMGVTDFHAFDVTGPSLPPIEGEEKDRDALLEQALRSRPDVRALEDQANARRLSLSAVRRGYWPTLAGSASVSEGGPQINNLDGAWSVGLALNWSLFEGGATRAQVGEATQNVKVTDAQLARLRLNVANELQQTLLSISATQAAERAANDAVSNARERLRLAEERYRTGLGSIIELSDAQTRATDAEAQLIEAHYNLSLARAALLRALGRP